MTKHNNDVYLMLFHHSNTTCPRLRDVSLLCPEKLVHELFYSFVAYQFQFRGCIYVDARPLEKSFATGLQPAD